MTLISNSFVYLLQVPCLEQTLAIMALHSNLFSVNLMRSLLLPNCSAHELRLSIKVVLCLPLLHLPSIFPVMDRCSKPLCRQICPKNFSCLFLIVLINDLSRLASLRTDSLDFFSVQDILIILLINHISTAANFLPISLFIV